MSRPEPEIFESSGSRLSLYRDAPTWDGKPCAAIGELNFKSKRDGIQLINKAISQIDDDQFHALLGPMNGDTWHPYRAVLQTDESAPFMLEPTSGPHDLFCLQTTGFEAVSHYHSNHAALADTLAMNPVTVKDVEITQWDGKNGEAFVDLIFTMSKDSFAKNSFFKPIELNAFRSLYIPLLTAIDPRFVLVATHKTAGICGFLFGYPDMSTPKTNPTIVLKTYASGMRGVGYALADYFHRTAIEAGFQSVIHALMQEENISLQRSAQHNAVTFRRYALLARRL